MMFFIWDRTDPGKGVIHKALDLLLIPIDVSITGLLVAQTPLPQV
jgi:hypothetical protein